VWHIKRLIKQHDHYTGAPCAADNKRQLKYAVVSQCHRCAKLREHEIGMLTAGMPTKAVSRKFNVHFSTTSRLQTGLTTADNMLGVVWASGLLKHCEETPPCWLWGYGMGSFKLQTMNRVAFYRMQFECPKIQ
jgi:hypothetical protein